MPRLRNTVTWEEQEKCLGGWQITEGFQLLRHKKAKDWGIILWLLHREQQEDVEKGSHGSYILCSCCLTPLRHLLCPWHSWLFFIPVRLTLNVTYVNNLPWPPNQNKFSCRLHTIIFSHSSLFFSFITLTMILNSVFIWVLAEHPSLHKQRPCVSVHNCDPEHQSALCTVVVWHNQFNWLVHLKIDYRMKEGEGRRWNWKRKELQSSGFLPCSFHCALVSLLWLFWHLYFAA